MAKYGQSASESVESAMRRRKTGSLRIGSRQRVTSRQQAIAIGLSEAREKGATVPKKSGGKGRSSRSQTPSRGSRRRSS